MSKAFNITKYFTRQIEKTKENSLRKECCIIPKKKINSEKKDNK